MIIRAAEARNIITAIARLILFCMDFIVGLVRKKLYKHRKATEKLYQLKMEQSTEFFGYKDFIDFCVSQTYHFFGISCFIYERLIQHKEAKKLKRKILSIMTAIGMMAMAVSSVPSLSAYAYQEGSNTYEWKTENGKQFWYENGERQGIYGSNGNVFYDNTERGREIYDRESDGWYWLDAVYDGAKATDKEVFMPYIYSSEEGNLSNTDWINEVAGLSNKTAEKVAADGGEVVDLSAQIKNAIECHGVEGAGKWVRYDSEGKMIKGWYKVQGSDEQLYPEQVGNVYYYDRQTGLMAKGSVTIDGTLYTFDEISGKLTSGNAPDIPDRNYGNKDNADNSGNQDATDDSGNKGNSEFNDGDRVKYTDESGRIVLEKVATFPFDDLYFQIIGDSGLYVTKGQQLEYLTFDGKSIGSYDKGLSFPNGVLQLQMNDGNINNSCLVDTETGETLVNDVAYVKLMDYSNRFLMVYHVTEETDNKDDAIIYVYEGKYGNSIYPGYNEGSKNYKGDAYIYDTLEKKAIEGIDLSSLSAVRELEGFILGNEDESKVLYDTNGDIVFKYSWSEKSIYTENHLIYYKEAEESYKVFNPETKAFDIEFSMRPCGKNCGGYYLTEGSGKPIYYYDVNEKKILDRPFKEVFHGYSNPEIIPTVNIAKDYDNDYLVAFDAKGNILLDSNLGIPYLGKYGFYNGYTFISDISGNKCEVIYPDNSVSTGLKTEYLEPFYYKSSDYNTSYVYILDKKEYVTLNGRAHNYTANPFIYSVKSNQSEGLFSFFDASRILPKDYEAISWSSDYVWAFTGDSMEVYKSYFK